jgi:hypothetical protein
MRLITITILMYLMGCGSDPEVACDAYVAPVASNSGGVTDNCDAGVHR